MRLVPLFICLSGSLLMSLASAPAPAASPESAVGPAPERPRIGLVLSGGGARGGVHIGVLRALEELRIPIDVVAGTSIGAAFGGLYAAGVSVAELERAIAEIDWEGAFVDDAPRGLRSFRRKRDDDLFLVEQRPGLSDGEFKLPRGLIQGQNVDQILTRLTVPVATVTDFDALRIPFRAVAADLATGETVVLGRGNLARAIRASMSVPAAISPVEIDGRLLVDGGITMNLPVDVARQMGADIVIAIDITGPLQSREELQSVVDVTGQLTSLMTRRSVEEQRARLGPGDVVIDFQFDPTLTPVSFTRIGETVPVGYDGVMRLRDQLARLQLSESAYAVYQAGLQSPGAVQPPVVDFVRLQNRSNVADRVFEARLADIEVGEPLDVDQVERAVGRLYGLQLHQNVRYGLVQEEDRTGVEIDLEPRSWGPDYLQLGMQYSSGGDQNALFGLAASYLRTEINELSGEWRATLVLGDEPALLTDLYQPFGESARGFFAPQVRLESRLFGVFAGDDVYGQIRLQQAMLELGSGREIAGWGEFRAGLRFADVKEEINIGDPGLLPTGDYPIGEAFVRLAADTMDASAFPRRGVLASGELISSRGSALGAEFDYDQFLLNTAYAKTWGRHTLLATLRYDTTLDGEIPLARRFWLGGFLDLSGLNRNQLSGEHVLRVGTSFYRQVNDLALFPAFAGISLELGNVWESRAAIGLDDAVLGGSLWAGVDTPVGPVYVSYGVAEGGLNAFYLFLGRPF